MPVSASPVSFQPDPEFPPLGQAVSLALAILRHVKLSQWDQMDGAIPAKVALLPGQLELLQQHQDVIGFVRSATRDGSSDQGTVTIAQCPECQMWFLVRGAASSTCSLTARCSGKPVKFTAAAKVTPVEVSESSSTTAHLVEVTTSPSDLNLTFDEMSMAITVLEQLSSSTPNTQGLNDLTEGRETSVLSGLILVALDMVERLAFHQGISSEEVLAHIRRELTHHTVTASG